MNNEIKLLRSELALLKLQFSERVNQVEERLNTLVEQAKSQPHSASEISDTKNDASVTAHQETLYLEENNPLEQPPLAVNEYSIAGVSSGVAPNKTQNTTQNKTHKPQKLKPAKPSAINLFLQSFIQTILSMMFEWLTPVANMYKSYKEKGMLGIFILTIAGIALVLAGFGYLMQLLIDQLGAGSKSLLMCFAALLVMGIGIGLKIKTRFNEFATAIVTLGILLSYCTVYFAGSVYGILPSLVVLALYFGIALLCHGIAKWLDTKVVSSLGIIGVATMPILSNNMSNTVQIEPLYYLLSLSFVAISSLIFAFKNKEQWLANLTLAFTLASVEWIIGVESIQISAWAVNLFYIIFFIYGALMLFSDKEHNEELSNKSEAELQQNLLAPSAKKSLLFIAALVGSTVLMFFQASELFTTQMSVCFTFNALLTVATAVLFYKVKHPVTPFIILLSALWGVLAIISAISNAYWGISWAVEGLLLLYVGRKYALSFVSNQAQALLAIALIYSWAAIAPYFPVPALQSVDGWVLSTAIILIIAIWQRMIATQGFDLRSQHHIKPLLQLVEVVWLSVLIIACSSVWLGDWTGVATISLQVFILFRARYCKQVSIELFAALLIAVPVFYIAQSALLVDSYRFSALPLFAKLAVISVFSQLWLWSAFYRKYHPNSSLKNIAEAARVLFYLLIPICWVGSAIRKLDENALLILWLSPALALFFAQKIKHHLLIKETKVLTVLASVLFMGVIGQLSLINSVLALLGFTAFYGVSYLLHRKKTTPIYQFICTWGLVSLGFALPNAVGFHTESLLLALLTAIIYWTACLALTRRSDHIKNNQTLVYIINCLLVVSGWVLTQLDPLYTIIPALFLIVMVYQQRYFAQQSFMTKFTKNNSHLLLHSVGVITYLSLFTALYQYRLELFIAPALAIHGAAILFLKNRHITTVKYSFTLILLGIGKLALVDAANALLWQKVILFMGIGIFILAASFWYQKLVSKMKLNDEIAKGIENEINLNRHIDVPLNESH
ncbi:DUF2339 domain-containing protein [Colwellia sp. RE-S-Sl-9]